MTISAARVEVPLNTKYWKCFIVLVIAFGGGYLTGAGNVDSESSKKRSEDKTKIVERVVVRTVTVTEKPDGTKVTETTDKVAEKDKESSKKKTKETDKTTARPQWAVGASVSSFGGGHLQAYTVTLHRRVLGNVWGGIYIRSDFGTDTEMGVGVRVEF